MLGNECPDCGVRIVKGQCPDCGWRPAAPASDKVPAWRKCERCGDTSPNVAPFHPDVYDGAHPDDRGARLCPSCWIPALRRRAELDPLTPEQRRAWRVMASHWGREDMRTGEPERVAAL